MKKVLGIAFSVATLSAVLVGTASAIFFDRPETPKLAASPSPHEEESVEHGLGLSRPEGPPHQQKHASSTGILYAPPLAYLTRVKGDPTPLPHEIAVRVPVLMYHHIREMRPNFTRKERLFSISPASFAAQMEGLKRAGYHTINPRDLSHALKEGAAALPSKPVLITLDDGYRDQYENALPVLQRLDLQSTFFIVSRADTLHGSMNKDMIRAAEKTGLVTIASHTEHHAFLTHKNPATRHEEIVGAKKDLETLLGHPVLDFAYPYGAWSPEIAKEVADAGYDLGFGVRLGSVHTSSSRYQLRRIRVLDGEDVVSLLDAFSR